MAVRVFLNDEELLHIAIKGLPKEYSAFRSAIRTRSTKLSFDELTTLLSAEEESLTESFEFKDSFAMVWAQTGEYVSTKWTGAKKHKGLPPIFMV